MMKIITLLGLLLLAGCKSNHVSSRLTDGKIFSDLALPTPSLTRTGSGAPGQGYWQQQVDHDIQVTLDVESNTIIGTQVIRYHNNSPDALSYIWLQLEQNVHRDDSLRSLEGRSTGEDEYPGISITKLTIQDAPVAWQEYVTTGKIELPVVLLPNSSVDIHVDWSFPMPTKASLRMGYEDGFEAGPVWELAQWIPVPCVYDDVYGWNTLPYIGRGEFYTNFGQYKVAITVPHDHLVFASGALMNPEEVLTTQQQERLLLAMESDDIVTIRSAEDIGTVESRPEGEEELTWVFEGDNIRTFAWASSASFIWDAASIEITTLQGEPTRVLCQAGYPSEATEVWDEAVTYVQHAIQYYSDMLYPYPWPQMSVVRGKAGGMEYPMIVFCRGWSKEGLFDVTDHEVGHNWFPMLVNTDERRHAWMDEGFDTFINYYSLEAFYGEEEHKKDVPRYNASRYKNSITAVNTPADLLQSRRHLSYRKPGYGLRFLREEILGEERFDLAFREYVRRWAFKSPRPADFYRTMEDASGMNLQWFFRGFFEETLQLDQSVAQVHQRQQGAIWKVTVVIDNLDSWVCPVDLKITCRDGSVHTYKLPVTIWAWMSRHRQTFDLPSPAVSVEIDVDHAYPDINRSNNTIYLLQLQRK